MIESVVLGSDTEQQLSRPLGPEPPARSGLDLLFGGFWPEVRRRVPARPRLVLAGALIALLGAIALRDQPLGLGWWAVLVAGAAVVGHPRRLRARPAERAMAGLGVIALTMIILRDAGWVIALCLLVGYAMAAAALGRAHTVTGMIVAAVTMPLAWLRGLPWLRRSITPRRTRRLLPVVRTLIISAVLLAVIGTLFAAADAVFARWLELALPSLSAEGLDASVMIFVALAALIIGGSYVAINPPQVERAALPPGRPVRRYEWLVPVGSVIAVFVVFLLAQLSALFGGHGYLRATTGLSYAEYVHQGFGQLTAVTVIVVIVVAVALRRAPRETPSDRATLRAAVGLLCGLALVVLASALHRLGLYEEAYGFTRLRLLVKVFELWLGVVLLLAMTAGVWLRARWIPRVAVLSGVLAVLVLAGANPDAIVARHNVERLQATGALDWRYLQGLSDDAVPAISRLPEPYRSCALAGIDPSRDSLLGWNLGRARAAAELRADPPAAVDCSALPSR